MKVEHIEAQSAKELTKSLNKFLEWVKKEYRDEPYVEIKQSGASMWHGFVFFEQRSEMTEQLDKIHKEMTDLRKDHRKRAKSTRGRSK
jgi:deferrochelatase/peroxidase EfeB